MKTFLTTVLLASVAWPAFAADLTFGSDVTAVTIFPSGAEVSRLGEGAIEAGDHSVTITGLPDGIDPASIRVSGTGDVVLGAVNVERVFDDGEADADAGEALQRQIDQLSDQIARIDRTIADIEIKRTLLKNLLMPGRGRNAKPVAPDALAAMMDLADTRFVQFADLAQSA